MRLQLVSFLLLLLTISACTGSEQGGLTTNSAKNASDATTKDYLEFMEESLNTSTLLYSRLSPEVAKRIKKVEMPPEAKEVASCLISKIKKEGLASEYKEIIEANRRYVDHIKNTPTLTMQNLVDDPKFNEIQAQMQSETSERFTEISKECGVISMNIKLSSQMGVTEALKHMPEE